MPDFQVKRCFIALVPDEVVRADLIDLMDQLDLPGLRLVKPDNLHVTVKFLGNVPDPGIPELIGSLQQAVAGIEPMRLQVTGVSYLPGPRRARVVMAKVERSPELQSLFDHVEEAMAEAGFRREGRAYNPHITLGRFNRPPRSVPDPGLFRFAETDWVADRVVLMQSNLNRSGATYIPLAEVPLT